jgi:hypothetical protein
MKKISMIKKLLITFLLGLSSSASLSATNSQQVAQTLALASGLYMMYADTSEDDWQIRKPFRAGAVSPAILAGTMKAIEVISETYWHTDFFTSTPFGKTIKILASVAAAAGFCQYLGVYKHMAEQDTQNRKWAYIKGLICGLLIMLPFCNDFQ